MFPEFYGRDDTGIASFDKFLKLENSSEIEILKKLLNNFYQSYPDLNQHTRNELGKTLVYSYKPTLDKIFQFIE